MGSNHSELDETITIRISSETLEEVDQQLPSAQRSETIRQLLRQSLTPCEKEIAGQHELSQPEVDHSSPEVVDKYITHLETQIQQKDEQIQQLTSQISELLNKID